MKVVLGVATFPTTEADFAEYLELAASQKKVDDRIDLVENPKYFVYVQKKTENWKKTAELGEKWGEMGITPKVLSSMELEEIQIIVTEAVQVATKVRAGPAGGLVTIREDDGDRVLRISEEDQVAIHNLLKRLVDNDMIHFHCTLFSVGFTAVSHQAVFTDMTAVQERKWWNGRDKLWAYGLCLYQLLERVPQADLEQSSFYKFATAATSGQYLWGEDMSSFDPPDADQLAEKYDSDKMTEYAKNLSDANHDIYIAGMCYASLLPLSAEEKSDRENLKLFLKLDSIRKC